MACNKLFTEVNDAYASGLLMRQNCLRRTWHKTQGNQTHIPSIPLAQPCTTKNLYCHSECSIPQRMYLDIKN